jgi:hypothetical protein
VSDAGDELAPTARTPHDERDFAPTMVALPTLRDPAPDPAPEAVAEPTPARRPTAQARRRPRVDREHTNPARKRWAVVGLVTALLALTGFVFWEQLAGAIAGAEPSVSAGERRSERPGLDGGEQDLVAASGVFGSGDCRPSTSKVTFESQQEAITCASDAQAPGRVVYRRFDNEADRDAAFVTLASGRTDGADCRVSDDAVHPYRAQGGDGRVLCNVANGDAGMTWTVPDAPIMGSAVIEETDSLTELYGWWHGMVGRVDGDRLPDCPVDEGLIERGATTAVQCQMTDGVATVASHAQFSDVDAMNAWYDAVVTNAREERLRAVREGTSPAACRRLGARRRRWTGADVTWGSERAHGRLLCFVNETDQNALFWTNEATGVGSVAVSPATDASLREMIDEWVRSPYRLAD